MGIHRLIAGGRFAYIGPSGTVIDSSGEEYVEFDEASEAEETPLYDVVATNGLRWIPDGKGGFTYESVEDAYGTRYPYLSIGITGDELQKATWSWGLASDDSADFGIAAVLHGTPIDKSKWENDLADSQIPSEDLEAFSYQAKSTAPVRLQLAIGHNEQ